MGASVPHGRRCGRLAAPGNSIDTWTGNQLFDVAKDLVAATNGLHYAIAYDEPVAPLDDAVRSGALWFYESTFPGAAGPAALILTLVLFRHIWRGDFAGVTRRAMWAVAAMWAGASFMMIGPVYATWEDEFLSAVTQVQNGFSSDDAPAVQLHALPEMFHTRIVYRNWLRGQFGTEDTPEAVKYGRGLVDAQAWSKTDSIDTVDQAALEAKKERFKDIYGNLGPARGNLDGSAGGDQAPACWPFWRA